MSKQQMRCETNGRVVRRYYKAGEASEFVSARAHPGLGLNRTPAIHQRVHPDAKAKLEGHDSWEWRAFCVRFEDDMYRKIAEYLCGAIITGDARALLRAEALEELVEYNVPGDESTDWFDDWKRRAFIDEIHGVVSTTSVDEFLQDPFSGYRAYYSAKMKWLEIESRRLDKLLEQQGRQTAVVLQFPSST